MADFIPPKHNPFLLTLTKFLLSFYLKQENTKVKISGNCIHTIQQLKNKHTVLLLNHSDRADPVTVMALAKACAEDFYYLAARELFDENFGLRGWFMKNCGAYSVIRGKPEDKESKEMTISLIVKGHKKLLMFPEGDVTGRDDKILPLKTDGLRNIFEAQRQLIKLSSSSIYLLPVAIFYDVKQDAIKPLSKCVDQLAKLLKVKLPTKSLEHKTEKLIEVFIENQEAHYSIHKTNILSLNHRLQNIVKQVCLSTAKRLNFKTDETPSETVLLYTVRGHLTRLVDDLKSQTNDDLKCLLDDLDRMEQLLIIASTLEEKPFTIEIIWRLVDRLEQQLTGKTSVKGHRVVYLEASQPIDLLELYPQYEQSADETIEKLSKKIQATLRETLKELKSLSPIKS
jgi:1-acyl-sn-glycerol-3-phosphate acyltransferase